MNDLELQITKAILDIGTVHYDDLSRVTGKSRKTIAKYLDSIEKKVGVYKVSLIRKRGIGVYFSGRTDVLQDKLKNGMLRKSEGTRDERVISLLSKLLLAKIPQSVQSLADASFVSRSTFEGDLRQLKSFLVKSDADLIVSNDGVRIGATERVRRRLMSKLLSMYWGQDNYLGSNKNRIRRRISIPLELQNFFDVNDFDKVLLSLDDFEVLEKLKLSDYEYQSLAIHLVIALERIKRDEVLEPVEHFKTLDSSTQVLTRILQKNFNLIIPKEEQQYINIHIIAAKNPDYEKVDDLGFDSIEKNSITTFLETNLNQYDATLIRNLTLHLIPALKRISLGLTLRNPYTEEAKKFFPLAYNRAVDIGFNIEREFNLKLNDEELAFIALHIEAFIERRRSHKVKAVIICSTGLGTARLLEQRIKGSFSNRMELTRVVSLQELKENPIYEDLVISTINIKIDGIPIVVVPPFLNEGSVRKIEDAISSFEENTPDSTAFVEMLNKHLITISHKRNVSRDDVITILGQSIQNIGYGKSGLIDAAIAREALASTAIEIVATPHAPIEYINTPCIAIYINHQGINWSGETVKIVFFLAMNNTVKSYIEKIYSYFNKVLENKSLLRKLEMSSDSTEVIKLLGGINND